MALNENIKIRSLKAGDIEQAVRLSSSEGWNQTETDWKLLIGNPANICIAAEYDNKIAGTATALNHSNEVAWIGMVIVEKALRGQGIGKLLMTGITDRLSHFRSVKLDATPAGLPLYKKLGFKEEFIIDRMICNSFSGKKTLIENIKAGIIAKSDMAAILELDKKVFGTSRDYLLEKLFSDYPEKALKLTDNKAMYGYVFGRKGMRYNYVGPLSASSHESARILMASALGSLSGQPVVVDILRDKIPLTDFLESAGFEKQRHFTRMYLKSNVFQGNPGKYYLISGPEYG